MTLASRSLVVFVVAAPLASLGCSDDDEPVPTVTVTDTGIGDVTPIDTGTPPGVDAVVEDAPIVDAPPPDTKAHVRIAHLSPDAPAVDVCVKPTGAPDSAYVGPLLNATLPGGLQFAQITQYLELDPGTYTARLVAADAIDCNSSLAGLPTYDLPALAAGTWATAAALGEVSASPATFTVKPFIDEHDAPASGQADIRFVHASPNTPAVDVGIGKGDAFTKIWGPVAFGEVGTTTGADRNGFLTTNPITDAAVVARASGTTTDALVIEPVSVPAGSVVSTWAIGLFGPGNGKNRLSVLICDDLARPMGGLSVCTRRP